MAFMDAVVVSDEAGVEKPHAEIFHIALQALGVTADQAIYVGDNYYDDVVGAHGAGMETLLINPYGWLGIEEIDHPHIIPGV